MSALINGRPPHGEALAFGRSLRAGYAVTYARVTIGGVLDYQHGGYRKPDT